MKELSGGLENISGFTFSAIECGIRYKDRLDLALIHSTGPCAASGVFTQNRIAAAPVKLCRERINNRIQTLVINATNANACTGEPGYSNALSITESVGKQLDVGPDSILMASTGIIGVQLPMEIILNSIPELTASLSPDNASLIPKAIMTTDTFPKEFAVSTATSQGEISICGIAKGSGMIAPNMATLLSFIITDASIPKKVLDPIFVRCIDKTLNALTIDGDTSTNDTAILLSPETGTSLSDSGDLARFEEALLLVLEKLSEMLIKDAEGATKCVRILVTGAASESDAQNAARSISESLLVKTAIFGNDPNWGRIACAAGYSGSRVEEKSLSISFEDITLLQNGLPVDYDTDRLQKIISRPEYCITVNLGIGDKEASYLTSDITYDYVRINAEYST